MSARPGLTQFPPPRFLTPKSAPHFLAAEANLLHRLQPTSEFRGLVPHFIILVQSMMNRRRDRLPPKRRLQTTSTCLAISSAVSFASFTQLILVETGLPQLRARVSANRPLAGLPISAAISFPPLTKRVLVLASTP